MNLSAFTPRFQPISPFGQEEVSFCVLRLDEIDPVVSGNKWYKLQPYVEKAHQQGKTTLVTFGGAFSNHLVATAAAAKMQGLKSIGIVRGEEPTTFSPTLVDAKRFGMRLHFLTRQAFSNQKIPDAIWADNRPEDVLIIPQGGYGSLGAEGAARILANGVMDQFTHFVCAVGSGTTVAGLVRGAKTGQHAVGIPALKNAFSLQQEVNALLPPQLHNRFSLQHDYHFGGYARQSTSLFHFMNEFYAQTGIPTDFVYSGKAFFAAADLAEKGFFPAGSHVVLIHTGGLQGNRSLKKGTLIFA